MNFLKDIISASGEADVNTIKQRLPIISSRISSSKQEVLKFIDDVYYKFSDWPKHNQKLMDISTQLSSDLQNLQQKIEVLTIKEIEENNTSINNLSEDLDQCNVELLLVTRIIQIHETLLTIRKLQEDKSYIKAASTLLNLEELMNNIPDEDGCDAITVLTDNVNLEKTCILNALCEMFQKVVQVHSKVSNNVQTNTIKITKKGESVTELFEMLDAFNWYNSTLDRVAKFILNVCTGIIQNVTTIKVHEEEQFHVIVVAIKKTVVKSEHNEVLQKLTELFSFLYKYFDYSIGHEFTTMRYFGNTVGSQFTDTLIKDCLDRTKPKGDAEVTNFETIIQNIVKFQQRLVDFNIFDVDNAILEYAKGMDELLIEQKCNQYLASAIALMKKDLHDSVEVGVKSEDGNLLSPEQFPHSIISRSVLDIIDLVRVLLSEALEVSDMCAARLICTAQSIFYQYGNIVHSHHERLLTTIPQQVALFRNNCLYIAHILVQVNAEFSHRFSSAALPVPPVFVDQGHQLKTIGGEIFLGYIDDQVRVMEMMVDEYLSSEQVSSKLNPDTEKLIRQCLRQYELLRTVWLKILPNAVYNKSIGYLFNSFCKKLIGNVISAIDIPTKNAEQLVETFKVVVTRGPKLFSSTAEIGLHVESWAKLNDLVFILGANLVSIDDMWADGKGVLTLTFPSNEVRSLIKALFQDTDRRAAVLSRIH